MSQGVVRSLTFACATVCHHGNTEYTELRKTKVNSVPSVVNTLSLPRRHIYSVFCQVVVK